MEGPYSHHVDRFLDELDEVLQERARCVALIRLERRYHLPAPVVDLSIASGVEPNTSALLSAWQADARLRAQFADDLARFAERLTSQEGGGAR